MKRFWSVLFLTSILFLFGALPVMAHGGDEEAAFDAVTNVKQAIVALDQPQPNMGVIDLKLSEVIDNKEEVSGVDMTKVEEAKILAMEENYDEATSVLFASIGEDPVGEDAVLGSPLQEYEKEFSPDKTAYLLLASAIIFIGIGGLILSQTKSKGAR